YVAAACTNADVSTNYEAYGIHTCDYDAEHDWQACLVEGNNSGGKMVSSFSTSMAFTGQQTLVYTWLAFAILFRSLCHYEWLLSTIAFMLYAVLGVVAYYSFNPFLPYPHQTAATVASLTYFIRPEMYDNTGYTVTDANGDKEFILNDSCDKAYHWNLSFLVVQYASVAIVVLLLGIAFSAERIRRRYPLQNPFPPLTGTTVPCVISAVVLAAYAVMVVSKADASIVNLSIMKDNLAANNGFPFAQGSVDICTVMLIVATMSVIRGTTRGSTSAFRLASVASILHIALVYPIVVGNYEVMDYNSMWTRGDYYGPDASGGLSHIFGTGCRGFWATYYLSYYNDPNDLDLTKLLTGNFVFPSKEQSDSLCNDTWVSFVAQGIIFVLMHFQIVFCGMVYKQNKGRPTDIYDPQPPSAPHQEPLLQGAGTVAVAGRI
ncbi:hypothetical protein TeGR_g9670, partial [Tetraparma gracilis]